MILPIYSYGHPILKKIAESISQDYPDLKTLIEDMWETMYKADGVGLAAPQIGKSIRLFVIDSTLALDDKDKHKGIKQVFINAEKIEESGDPVVFEEGCLSIPDIRGDVERDSILTIRFLDENFQEHIQTFDEVNARVIQHEYDHLEGILFTEHLKPLKRRLIRGKLEDIRNGKIKADYKMKFPLEKSRW